MPHPKFIAHLQAIEGLSDDERRQIAALPSTLRQVSDGEILLRQGEDASRCVFVVSGFLYQARIVGDRSQILAFHVHGNMPWLHTLLVSPMDADLVGLGPSIVGYVAHSPLKQLLERAPRRTGGAAEGGASDLRARRKAGGRGPRQERPLPDADDPTACRGCLRTV